MSGGVLSCHLSGSVIVEAFRKRTVLLCVYSWIGSIPHGWNGISNDYPCNDLVKFKML